MTLSRSADRPAENPTRIRLFYGVYVDEALRDAVVELQDRLRVPEPRIKWVERENLHFTLRFIGDVPVSRAADFAAAGRAAAPACTSFDMQLRGAGAFPSLANPNTIWLGAAGGAEAMIQLHRALSDVLDTAALAEPESRAFVPHCTLGRVRQGRGRRPRECGQLAQALEAEAEPEIGAMSCGEFCLISSTLTSSGPQYEAVESFALPDR